MLKSWRHVSGDRFSIQCCVPLGSMLYAQLERTQTLGFESKSMHLTLYQRKVTSEELPHWPLKQPKYAYILYFI